MGKEKNNQHVVEQLLRDEDFSRRTAAAVVRRAEPQRFAPYWAAAVAVIAAGALWFSYTGIQSGTYAGLSETSATAVLAETQNAWEDTDLVINASLTR